MAKQRIGILGGTFDPIHRGHIQMGRSVLDAGYVDSLLMVPTGHPPYKNCTADAEDNRKQTRRKESYGGEESQIYRK